MHGELGLANFKVNGQSLLLNTTGDGATFASWVITVNITKIIDSYKGQTVSL